MERSVRVTASGYQLSTTHHPLTIGCQGWTRTNTERLNRPPCYFDTTWQLGIGAASRICTRIGSFRRRMPHVFGHNSEMGCELELSKEDPNSALALNPQLRAL